MREVPVSVVEIFDQSTGFRARVRPCVPCVPCVSRLPPLSFYR